MLMEMQNALDMERKERRRQKNLVEIIHECLVMQEIALAEQQVKLDAIQTAPEPTPVPPPVVLGIGGFG